MDPVTLAAAAGGAIKLAQIIAPVVAEFLEKHHDIARARANHDAMILADELTEAIRLAVEKDANK